ncbi:hypothetical protein [Corynebacterium crudilactis]|uniref:Uncharacterized protein n=1 Tax=Corynebacterium crudilactis TaxID=1652495 RepID=A0A172QXT3_9CORY|nr:hypothetical protein [Corynebacterium crudilactis]ANE05517.1 hypothetical protein ccrud_14345 [Corynebacterium crudilactis]
MTAQGFIEDLLKDIPEWVEDYYIVNREGDTVVIKDWVGNRTYRSPNDWENPHGHRVTLEDMEAAADQWAEEALKNWEDQEPEDLKSAMAYTKKNFDFVRPSGNIALSVFGFATEICTDTWPI